MPSDFFPAHEIRDYALPAIIDAGNACFAQGRVRHIRLVGNDIIAQVIDEPIRRVTLSRHGTGKVQFSCSCGFSLGCACEHAVAVMLAANAQQAIQTGMDLSDPLPSHSGVDRPRPVRMEESGPGASPDTHIETVTSRPVARLYLSERESMLLIELRFAYFGNSAEFTRSDPAYRLLPAGEGKVVRIERSRARESAMTADLLDSGLRTYHSGTFTPVDEAREWIKTALPKLARAGYEIYGQENLTTSRTRTSLPRLRVSLGAPQGELFTCEVNVEFDGIPVTLSSLIAAVRDRARFVLLSDGSTGELSVQWLERLAAVFAVARVSANGACLQLRRSQAALAQVLGDMALESGEVQTPLKPLTATVAQRDAPQGFSGRMRPYQQSGYEWFYFLQESRSGGCLADDMGLGKTVQTIALLQSERNRRGRFRTSLVVAPASLLFNWEREARTFAPGLIVVIYHGPDRKRRSVDDFDLADIVLTTYGTLLRDLAILKKVRFNYVILDEAQAIKSPLSHISRAVRELCCENRLALSGTPIENNLSELWSLFTFLNPGLLGSYAHFTRAFARPIERDGNGAAADVLRKLIFPFVLRRTKRQVAPELPPKTETLLDADMLPRQRMVYEATRDLFRGRILRSIDQEGVEGSHMQILEALLRLRQICCHPGLADAAFGGDSGKFQLIDAFLDEAVADGHKILIFSQFVKALEVLRERIGKRGISSEILTGQTADRAAVVDRFQNDPAVSVFLISLKAGGTGLNLTSADYVVHLDPWWNPAAEDQASDRAYRIGQTRPVFVYKLVMRDSIEERVLTLQESKRRLVGSVIGTEASFFKDLTRGDIETLLS